MINEQFWAILAD